MKRAGCQMKHDLPFLSINILLASKCQAVHRLFLSCTYVLRWGVRREGEGKNEEWQM